MNRRDVLTALAAFVTPTVLMADDVAYWRARVNASLAIHEAESTQNPWYPPVPPPKPEAAPKAETEIAKRPVVYRLHASWCGPCKAVERLLTKQVRDKLPFEIQDWDVDQRGWMGAPQIPAFWWSSPQGNLRCGWSGIESLVKTWEASQKLVKK